jgi:hypothetical protein
MMTVYKRVNGCTFCIPENQLYQNYLLKVFNGPDGPWERALAAFSMCRLIGWRNVEHEIYQQKQLVALNLSSASFEERDSLMGRVLLVRKTEPIPMTFIGTGQMDVEIFQNGEMILAEDAEVVLRDLSLKTGNDLSGFLEIIMAKTVMVHLQSRDYLAPRKMTLEALVLNFGIGHDEETGKPVPLWTGSGISPKTAIIMDGNEEMKDLQRFAELVLPESVYKKELEGKA